MSTDNEKEQKAPAEKKITMRNHWFDHVAKTRKKLTRARKQPITHREAMREASVTWTAIKDRVRKRNFCALLVSFRYSYLTPVGH